MQRSGVSAAATCSRRALISGEEAVGGRGARSCCPEGCPGAALPPILGRFEERRSRGHQTMLRLRVQSPQGHNSWGAGTGGRQGPS